MNIELQITNSKNTDNTEKKNFGFLECHLIS